MTQGYPTSEQVEAADQVQLMRWTRFLPSPTDENRATLERILQRQTKFRLDDPEGYTAASKAVGH